MKCSTILLIVILLIFCSYNISKNVLGYWSIVVYVMVSILSFCLLHRSTKNSENINDFPNLWPQFKRNIFSNIVKQNTNQNVEQFTMCLVCSDLDCNRHDSELNIFLKPWKHLLIDNKVNLELEELFNFLLHKYTSPWLDNISYNRKNVLTEFKQLIKIIASSLIIRVKDRLKLNKIIITKLPKFLMHHLEMYIHGKRKAKSARFLEESVLREYGNLLHPALTSSENEMKYLKSIANLIIYTTLPPKYIRCDASVTFLNEFISCCILSPLVEIFIDPDKINMLLICLLEKSEIKKSCPNKSKMDKVEFLNGFLHTDDNQSSNCLGIELKRILDDQHLLFLFTQYSKEEYFTNFLQFRMHMNLFLTRIINPDLKNEQLKELHQDLTNIYNLYIVKNSNDQIQFNESIQQDFYKIVNGNYLDIHQFRNSKSLYESYEYVNEVLQFYCRKFFYTDVYLKLVCGQRSLSFNMGDDNSSNLENSNNYNSLQSDLNLDFDPTGCVRGKILNQSENIKDLSNWRISILQINTRIDPVSGRECYYFEIEVVNLDEASTKWTVERQLNEFYILESKLKEFHGEEMDNIILPTKKPFSRVSKSAMENCRYDFEKFLKSLLGNITLKRSELIYNFLSSSDFTSNCFMENFKFSKMIKNVPSKFAKERGQHLYSFLKNFVTLSEKSNKFVPSVDNNGLGSTEESRRKSRKSLAQSDIDFDSFDDVYAVKSNCDRVYAQIEYIYDYILLILIRFYNLNNWILQCLYLIRPLVRQSFQGFCLFLVGRQMRDTLFTSNKIAELIRSLKKSLDDDDGEDEKNVNQNSNDIFNLSKCQRSQLALKLATDFIPKWFLELISIEFSKHEEMVFLIFSLLQNRFLNKQLLFVILDSIFADMFPPVLYPMVNNLASSPTTS